MGPEDIEQITDNNTFALSEVMITLQSLSKNVGELSKKIDQLFRWAAPVLLAVVVIIVTLVK